MLPVNYLPPELIPAHQRDFPRAVRPEVDSSTALQRAAASVRRPMLLRVWEALRQALAMILTRCRPTAVGTRAPGS